MLDIFAGYIFVFFHIRLNGFDLLIDFIGYIMIYVGLGKLSAKADSVQKAKPWAAAMAVIELLALFVQAWGESWFGLLWSIAASAACVYLLYRIVCGVQELESGIGADLNAQMLVRIWKVQAPLILISTALSVIFPEVAAVLAVAASIANIVFLVYFHRTRKAYENTL